MTKGWYSDPTVLVPTLEDAESRPANRAVEEVSKCMMQSSSTLFARQVKNERNN
jgi:hypothetical protein